MQRSELEHLIGAAANIVQADHFVVVGSQAILGTRSEAPALLLRSMEADIYPRDHPERAVLIEGALGDGSQFHRTFGYYAQGVGPETPKAPAGWADRLVPWPVPPRPGSAQRPVAHCLTLDDLLLAKCSAGRDKDWAYIGEALSAGLADAHTLLGQVDDLPVAEDRRAGIRRHLQGLA